MTPAPVEPITTWMIWTELVIPALGVLGSAAIAVIALWLASRDRHDDRKEQDAQHRGEVAVLLRLWAHKYKNANGMIGNADTLTEARRIATKLRPTAGPVVDWAEREAGNSWKADGILTFVRGDFVEKLTARIDDWERTGRLDASPLSFDEP